MSPLTLKMEASCFSEMPVYILTVPEHRRPLSTQCHEKLKILNSNDSFGYELIFLSLVRAYFLIWLKSIHKMGCLYV